ncbi:hypothetical protein [Maridesulfovibrio bastinii]|uniref:hypothetical protein n=1 Tax=Maridesulfovibrio bastinii TaxID=47157 RepID=UPI0003F7BE71|nr:hypothetical protein [Maridesulfovibrio bastinii]
MEPFSDITIFLSSSGLAIFNNKLAEAQKKLTKQELVAVQEMLEENISNQTGQGYGGHLFYWTSTAWDHRHPLVSLMESVLAELDSIEYSFLRIGEDESDFETRGDFYNNPFDNPDDLIQITSGYSGG